ncbi:MAG: FAD-binding oxidoreductase [Acidimicrobiia bacterium]
MDHLVADLCRIVGERHVLTDSDLVSGYESDWTGRFRGRSRCVVRPGSTAEVVEVLRLLDQAGIPVVPQGGNTGLSGGAVPLHGEVVLSLRRLASLEPVDRQAAQVTAGAGVTLADLHRHAASAGYEFGVDLAARDSATVGGMVATNAGGLRALRHGHMRAQVMGLEAVLADGRVLRRLGGLAADNTGYDLTGLLVGSEGTLAVVTAARLRLLPGAGQRVVALLAFGGVEDLLAAAAVLRDALASIEAAEAFFAPGVELVRRHLGVGPPFSRSYPAYLLVECVGRAAPVDDLAGAVDGLGGTVLEAAVALEAASRARLWRLREAHTEAIGASGRPHKLDVSLPPSRLARFVEEVGEAVAAVVPDARCFLFGHVGVGSIHVNVLGAGERDEVDEAVLELAARFGGSISSEHGIGTAKRRFLALCRSPEELSVFATLKAALDPRRILNPHAGVGG